MRTERLRLLATSRAQAKAARKRKSESRQIGRKTTALEIVKAQETKRLIKSTADLEKRPKVLYAKTKHLRKESDTTAMATKTPSTQTPNGKSTKNR